MRERFAAWLQKVRVNAAGGKVSQAALADRVHALDPDSTVSQARVSEWERGEGLPSLRQLRGLCVGLELSVEATAEGRAMWEAAQLGDAPAPIRDTRNEVDPDSETVTDAA